MTKLTSLFSAVPKESQNIINHFDDIAQSTFPLNSKQLYHLPENIRTLSHLLTDDRPSRRLGYMNETVSLAAYIRYFMWWNLVRLTPLFSSFALAEDSASVLNSLSDGDVLLDIGSGPLTVPIALWLACPELRKKKLIWYCLDYSQTALSHGEDLYSITAARTAAATPDQQLWQIIRVKGSFGTEIKRKAKLVSCANVFNELFWNSSQPLEQLVKKYSAQVLSYADRNATVLLVEPGIPRAARFVSLFRDALIRKGFSVLSPCPHMEACPMDGRKGGKWCHFVLDAENAPERLKKLSLAAGIPKDRASLSFVLASSVPEHKKTGGLLLRVISDPITLFDKTTARYSCSRLGLTLAIAPENQTTSGDLVATEEKPGARYPTDRKSGAPKVAL